MFRSTDDRPASSTAASRGFDVSPTAFLDESPDLLGNREYKTVIRELGFRNRYQLYVTIKLDRC
ncbi:hypothetical protein C4D60_Mb04t24070 [Musa balbisiana]|uniref:Uncharacterized protein n=1 Tax=Musa balbisiana TaxID=52838 RepID=A0A4S8KE97_MUSBA|nr:hypothetical protein C4D60_Mb04t24070 [Musa balbisiana]